jgi:glucokinase
MATHASDSAPDARARKGVRLVADLGGTNARFAVLGESAHDLRDIETLPCADYPRVTDAIGDYLQRHHISRVSEMCMAIAGPVGQDVADLPNNHWTFSVCGLRESLGAPVAIINDFTAQSLSIDVLEPDEFVWFGTPRPVEPGIRTVLGPGTGLGIAIQMVSGEIIPSEGGHVGFAPSDDHEMAILRSLIPRFRRVSAERLLSGPGLENIYWANRQIEKPDPSAEHGSWPAHEIARLASEGDAVAQRTVNDFFDILATFAGDMALFSWSTGGVYLSGGVLRWLFEFLDVERFRARFEDKGRFTRFCETVPLAWITNEYPGLLGCAAVLERTTPAAALTGTATTW